MKAYYDGYGYNFYYGKYGYYQLYVNPVALVGGQNVVRADSPLGIIIGLSVLACCCGLFAFCAIKACMGRKDKV